MGSQILPTNASLVDGRGNIMPEWYRYFASLEKGVNSIINITIEETQLASNDAVTVQDDGSVAAESQSIGGAPPVFEIFPDILLPPPVEPDPVYRAATLTVATDADFTVNPNRGAQTIRHTGTLTADRAVTLATAGAFAGSQTLVSRSGAGAFNMSIGGLKNLATNTWALVEYDGSAWFLASYGAL